MRGSWEAHDTSFESSSKSKTWKIVRFRQLPVEQNLCLIKDLTCPYKSAVFGLLSGARSSAVMMLEPCVRCHWKGQSLLQMGKIADSGKVAWTGSGGRWAVVHSALVLFGGAAHRRRLQSAQNHCQGASNHSLHQSDTISGLRGQKSGGP